MSFVCGLDIDTNKIVGILARLDHKKNILDIYIEKNESKGFCKGRVTDIIIFSECVLRIINNLENKSGNSIRNVFVNTKGEFIKNSRVSTAIPLSQGSNRVVRFIDAKKVNKFAHDLGLDINEEAIFEMPFKYKIDSHDNIQEPVGLSGHKLEIELLLIKSDVSYLEGIRQAFRHIGVNMNGFVLSGIATGMSVLDKKDRVSQATLIDISDDISEIINFSNNKVVDYCSINFGYNNLNAALMNNIGVSEDVANQINNSYAVINMPQEAKDEEVVIKKDFEYQTVNKSLISSIVTEETKFILDAIKKELWVLEGLSENIVITGEITLIEGFIELAEKILEKSLKLGRPKDTHFIPYFESIWGVRALGLVKYSIENSIVLEKKETGNLFSDLIFKAREIYQDYF